MIFPVSTLCNSDHPKLSLYEVAKKKKQKKKSILKPLKCIPTAEIWFVTGIFLAHGYNNLVCSLSMSGNGPLTKQRT